MKEGSAIRSISWPGARVASPVAAAFSPAARIAATSCGCGFVAFQRGSPFLSVERSPLKRLGWPVGTRQEFRWISSRCSGSIR